MFPLIFIETRKERKKNNSNLIHPINYEGKNGNKLLGKLGKLLSGFNMLSLICRYF